MIHPPQEPDIVPGRKIAVVGVATVIATIVGVLVAYGIGQCGTHSIGVEVPIEEAQPVRTEVNQIERSVFAGEAQGIEDHRQVEAVLGSYGWVDRKQQIVRIPVERAYAIVQARHGTQAAAGQQRRPGAQAPQGQQARQRPPGPQRPSAPPRTPEPRDPLLPQAQPGGQR